MRSNVTEVSSFGQRAALESASLALLLASVIFTAGRGRYEAVALFSIDDVSGLSTTASAPISLPTAAKQLLARALKHANDPPAPEQRSPREFRVDLLRNHQLQLNCEAESRGIAEALCTRIAQEATTSTRELRSVGPAKASMLLQRRLFDAAWPALLAGFGWLLIRTSRSRSRQHENNAANPSEWQWSVPSSAPPGRSTSNSAPEVRVVPSREAQPSASSRSTPLLTPRRGTAARRPIGISKTMVGMPAVAPPPVTSESSTEHVASMSSVDSHPPPAAQATYSSRPSVPRSSTPPGAGISGTLVTEHLPPPPTSRRPPASGPDPSTRVIYHVSAGAWTGDSKILTGAAVDQLRDVCDEVYRTAAANCIVVRVASSTNSRYAKSQVAAQLAWLLAAQKDKRVLLVEADLDAPALHKVLRVNVPHGFGFSEQLERMGEHARNGHSALTLLRVTPQLHALLESSLAGAPALFDSPQFAASLTEQRNAHDVIVLDGPVVDDWSDAQMIRRVSDSVVFVVAAGTPLADAKKLAAKHFEPQRLLRTIKTGEWPNA